MSLKRAGLTGIVKKFLITAEIRRPARCRIVFFPSASICDRTKSGFVATAIPDWRNRTGWLCCPVSSFVDQSPSASHRLFSAVEPVFFPIQKKKFGDRFKTTLPLLTLLGKMKHGYN